MSSYTSGKNCHLISKLFNLYQIPQKQIFDELFFNIRLVSTGEIISVVSPTDKEIWKNTTYDDIPS